MRGADLSLHSLGTAVFACCCCQAALQEKLVQPLFTCHILDIGLESSQLDSELLCQIESFS